jgi:hypothetical protein
MRHKPKALITFLSCVVMTLLLIQSRAYGNAKNGNFLQQIGELNYKINQQIRGLSSDFTRGIDKLSGEVQSQINQQLNQVIKASGLPDLVKKGQEIEEAIAGIKTGVLEVDARIQGKNARQVWNQQYTVFQADGILGAEGQQKNEQERQVSQMAVDTTFKNAQEAQNDFITQDIIKKIATQNAQTTAVLQLVQGSLIEQNKLTAASNVNLSDISQNLAVEHRRKQNESQGVVNAIYRNAAFADGFWNSGHK